MKSFYLICSVLCLLLFSCAEKKPVERMNEEQLRAFADELAHKYVINDGHVDLPFRLKIKNFRIEREYMSIPVKSDEGDFDYERAKKGGLSAPFMSIYIPSSYQAFPDKGKILADSHVLRVSEKEFLITSAASPAAVIRQRLEEYIVADDVTLADETASTRGLLLGGAGSNEVIKQVLADVRRGTLTQTEGQSLIEAAVNLRVALGCLSL